MESTTPITPIQSFVRSERELAREQIGAAWQIHVEKVQEQLQQGWRENVATVLEQRFSALEESFAGEVDRRVTECIEEGSAHARRRMSERLNQIARRLEQAEDINAWTAAILDGAQTFAPKAALFSVLGGSLKYEAYRAAEQIDIPADTHIPLASAPAFQSVLDTLDTVIAVASPGEISNELSALLRVDSQKRVCLLPIATGRRGDAQKVAAILFAEPGDEPLDLNALELLASLAGTTLECRFRSPSAQASTAHLMGISPASVVSSASDAQHHVDNAGEAAERHLQAQRFARVRVAEIRLYHAAAVVQGREQGRLYEALRPEVDRGREDYRTQFLDNEGMPDYLHQELIRTLAQGNPTLMGLDYPGPLV